MNRIKHSLRNALLILCAFTSLSILGQTVVNIGGIRYIIENNSATVGRQDVELSGDIVIPETIEYNGSHYTVANLIAPSNLTSWSSNTVTTEGGAFQSCQITSVVIPSTIKSIAAGAFNGCSNLKNVTLPNGLLSIGAASFANCTSLENLTIPESVTAFGSSSNYGFVSYTFGGCSKLKNINIPSGITTLNAGCFMGCGLDSIFIPSTIRSLGDNSLAMPNLRVVKMGIANLSSLSYSQICFQNVDNTDLYVPKGSLVLYQEYEPWSNFRSIQEYGDEGEEFVPDQINVNYNGIKYILKNDVATVARQSANLSGTIVIPDKVAYDGKEYPVTGFVPPTDLTAYSSNSVVCVGGAFQNTLIEEITIPSTITSIAAGAFQNCKQLKTVHLPETLKQLSAACFAGCTQLMEINIPEGLTDLGSSTRYGYKSYAFGGCNNLTSFIVPSGVRTIPSGCFLNSGLENITIPSTCTTLVEDCLDAPNLKLVKLYVRDMFDLTYTESCFGNVSGTKLLVPHGSKQVYCEFYPWMDFESIEEFDDGFEEFVPSTLPVKIDNVRYILYDQTAIVGRQDKNLSGNIVIPSSLSYNGKEYHITGMVEPTELTAWSSNTVSTENGAFQSCKINSIYIPSSVQRIPPGAFYNCNELTNVQIEDGIIQLGAACFAGCNKLVELKIPESVTSFGSQTRYGFKSYIFGNCTSLKKVNIPSAITSFTEGCFKGCGLETFIIPQTVTRLKEDCFSMNGLKAIKITHRDLNNLTYTESIFSNVSNVSLYVPEGTSNLYNEFYPWKNFKEIVEYQDQDDEFNFNAYSLTYLIPNDTQSLNSTSDETVYIKGYIPSGIEIDDVESPYKDGYEFVGWTEIPQIMPSHDVVVEAIFQRLYDKADVNLDGEINIADINVVINVILGGNSQTNTDVNGDGEVNIADINVVIDKILRQ